MKTDELFEVNPSKGFSIDFWIILGVEPHPVLPSHLKLAEKTSQPDAMGVLLFFDVGRHESCDFLWKR